MGSERRRVLISAEVLEEIEEVYGLLERAEQPFTEIVIDGPDAVLQRLKPEIVHDRRVALRPYTLSTRSSVRNKLLGLISFAWLMLRERPQLLFSGFSMMKHRAVSGLLHVPHFAYIRGVTFDPATSVGISDGVRQGRFRRLVPQRVVATYHADEVFTVGEINRRFIVGRGMPDSRVHVVGPVWLDQARPARSGSKSPATYVVTGAWAAHGFHDEHDAQTSMLADLAATWHDESELVIRVHPRDDFPYSADPRFSGVHLSTEPPAEFLASLGPADVVVAPLSTLAFEALHLGARVAFYADEHATRSYNHVYKWLGIVPCTGRQIAEGDVHPITSTEVDVFSPVELAPVRRAFATLR